MPNVQQMSNRFNSHLARVNGKALDREFKRIEALYHASKISSVTRTFMQRSAHVRLAWLAH